MSTDICNAYACTMVRCDTYALGRYCLYPVLSLLLQMARSYDYWGLRMWENGIARSWGVTIFSVAGECGKLLTVTGQILLLLLMLSGTSGETCRWNVLLIMRMDGRAWPHSLCITVLIPSLLHQNLMLQQQLRQVYRHYRNVVILLEKYRGSIKFWRQDYWDNGTTENKTPKPN